MIKAAFFDIDGTLVSFRTHRVPASAHEAPPLALIVRRNMPSLREPSRPTFP